MLDANDLLVSIKKAAEEAAEVAPEAAGAEEELLLPPQAARAAVIRTARDAQTSLFSTVFFIVRFSLMNFLF